MYDVRAIPRDLLGGDLRKALLVKPPALAAAAHMWSHEHRPGNTGPLVTPSHEFRLARA